MADLYPTDGHSNARQLTALFRSLFGASFFLLLARIFGAGIGVGLQLVIARFYGAEILGNYYLAFGLAAVLSIILTMGFPWIIAPVVAKSDKQRVTGHLTAFLRIAYQHLAAATMLIALPVMAAIWLLPNISGDLRWALSLAVLTAPVFALMRLNSALANARKYFLIANLPELMFRPLFLLLFIFLAVAFAVKLDSTLLVAFNLVVTIVFTIWIISVLHLKAARQQISADNVDEGEAVSPGQWRKLAFPMIFATLFVSLFADLDILIVGSILPASQIGVFGVCIKITFIMAFAIQIAHQILLRDASDAFASGRQQQLRTVIASTNRFTFGVTLAGLIMTVIFGPWVLGIFGEEFPAGYGCLVGLMLAQLIRAMAGPAIQVLMISGNQRDSLAVYFICIILLLVLNILLVPAYGYLGAAAAVICTTVYLVVALDRIVHRKLGFSVSIISCRK